MIREKTKDEWLKTSSKCVNIRIVSGGAYCKHPEGSGFCDFKRCPINNQNNTINYDAIVKDALSVLKAWRLHIYNKRKMCDFHWVRESECNGMWYAETEFIEELETNLKGVIKQGIKEGWLK
jgi:hypothetical protein